MQILDSSLRFGMTVGTLGMTSSPRHSEERTTKNLRCLHTSWLVVVMDRPLGECLRFLTAVRNDSGGGSE